jgi:aminocarboxymuconate-semialdehyde decarboxylase
MSLHLVRGVPAEGPPADDGVLDVHAHVMPLPLLQGLADRGLADLAGVPAGMVRLDPRVSGMGPRAPLPLPRSMYDVGMRLSEMDEVGVHRQAVSLPPFLVASTADDEQLATRVVAEGNDELAVHVADAPDRLLGLGSVPIGRPGAAEEARRALDELGMTGIAIGSPGAGRDLDDPVNDDLWALLSERRSFVLLHPSGVRRPPRQEDLWSAAVARVMSGRVLGSFPLNLCLAGGGRCLPSLRGRLDGDREPTDVARTTAVPPREFTDAVSYDTAVSSPHLLRRLVEDVGAGHVLLGTDHPFGLGDHGPLDSVRALGLPEADERRVLGGNAARLLGLPVRRAGAVASTGAMRHAGR